MSSMMLVGAVFGVAHAKDSPPLSPIESCNIQCWSKWVTCKVAPNPWPSLPGGPNPNATDEQCKEAYDSCKNDCKAKYPISQ